MDTLKGRYAPPEELAEFTFPLSHITVRYRLLSQFTLGHIETSVQKTFLPPPIPTFTYETDDGSRTEPNPADPTYQAALSQYNMDRVFKVLDGMIELAVVVDVDQPRVDELKRVMDMIGTPLHEISDKVVYVKHCCVVDAMELIALGNKLKGVTEEAIQAKQDTFPGDVQAEADPALSLAVERALV